mgnify:CR=1 FL=1
MNLGHYSTTTPAVLQLPRGDALRALPVKQAAQAVASTLCCGGVWEHPVRFAPAVSGSTWLVPAFTDNHGPATRCRFQCDAVQCGMTCCACFGDVMACR